MESTIGSGDTITYCSICRTVIVLNKSRYSWSPFPKLNISRNLCGECGLAFETKTRSLFAWAKAQTHSKYIEWEQSLRLEKDMANKQLKIPGV